MNTNNRIVWLQQHVVLLTEVLIKKMKIPNVRVAFRRSFSYEQTSETQAFLLYIFYNVHLENYKSLNLSAVSEMSVWKYVERNMVMWTELFCK
jgi:hypothetical protein